MTDSHATAHPLAPVASLLADGKPQDALNLIERNRLDCPASRNARAVCLLRLRETQQAADILKALLFPQGSISPSSDAPAELYANYAAALMLQGNPMGALGVLDEAPYPEHPAIQRTLAALRRWRRSLGPGWRLLALVGLYPARVVTFEEPPGELM